MNELGCCVIIARLFNAFLFILICTGSDTIMIQDSKFLSNYVSIIVPWMFQTFKPVAELNFLFCLWLKLNFFENIFLNMRSRIFKPFSAICENSFLNLLVFSIKGFGKFGRNTSASPNSSQYKYSNCSIGNGEMYFSHCNMKIIDTNLH